MYSSQEIQECLAGIHDGWLFQQARQQTQAVFEDNVRLRAVIEFSSYCERNCHYCGLRRANFGPRYRLSRREILACADTAVEMGFETLVLQGGEDTFFSAEDIAEIIAEIRQRSSVAITLSLGEQEYQTLALWKNAGADRYLLKLETIHPQLHSQYRPGCSLENRIQCLTHLQSLGYETGSGCIVGLPAGKEDLLSVLARDIIFLSGLNLHMVAAGPFIPHPQTPLGTMPHGSLSLSHRTLAVLRLCNPQANIPATSAMDALARILAPTEIACEREKALQHSCNVVMEAIPLPTAMGSYDIYPDKKRHVSPYLNGACCITNAQKKVIHESVDL